MKVALSGMMAALSAVLLFFTGVIPSATIALPALAGCLLIPVVSEAGMSWGWGSFLVCGLLAFLLAPDREAVLIYLLFFGYYPVLFGPLERIRHPAPRWGVKLALFNLAALAEAWLTIAVLGIPWENLSLLGQWTAPVLLVLANVVFVVYDRALYRLILLYLRRLRGRVQKLLRGGS